MQKNFSSFWDLIQSRPIPPRAIITAAPEHLYELVRTCLKGTQSTMNHASTQRIRELLTNLQEVDLFSEPSMMIIEGAPTVQQVELLRTYDSRLQPDDTLWLLTTSRKVALNWPIIAYYPPTLNDLQHLLKCTPLEAKTLFETTELNDPLCIIQLVQQAQLGLPLTHSLSSPFEGSCWDILKKIYRQPDDLDLSLDHMTQLSFALEMIHQASSTPHAQQSIYLPAPFKQALEQKNVCEKIDSDLLPFYQKILQALLQGDKTNAQYFTRLWIKAFTIYAEI